MTRSAGSRLALWVLLALALAAAAGCGVGQGQSQGGGVDLRVTRDFGAERLGSVRRDRVAEGETVMRLLQSSRRVKTSYGGNFVESIDGLAGEGPEGRRDWFYFVNGLVAEVGAAERVLAPGDVVQWDFRDWAAAIHIPAIVGAFPEPFLSGTGGKRFPVRIECEDDASPACAEARRRLTEAGAPPSTTALGTDAGENSLRVVVARWSAARGLRPPFRLEGPPDRSGVFARFDRGGSVLSLLDARGRAVRTAPPGTGLVAATAGEGNRIAWLITGLDEAGVLRAARSLDERVLRDRFAVAATPAGPVALPVAREAAR